MADKQQYIYRIQPVRPAMLTDGATPEEQQVVSAHYDYLKFLMESGTVVMAGRTTNTDYSSFGIVIFVAIDDAAAKQIMLNDPAIKNRVMRGEVYPYRVALFQPENLQQAQ